MADAQVKKLVARLSVEGAQQSKADLQAFAKAGEEALARTGGEGRRAAAAMEALGKSANDNRSTVTRFGEAFDAADGKIKTTVRGINDVRGAIELIAPEAGAATQGIAALAGTVSNLADVAGTLANVFLRNPIGLIAIALSAAAVAYLTLRDRVDATAQAEESYQKALAATQPLLEKQIDATRALAVEKARAAQDAVRAAIVEQEQVVAATRRTLEKLEAEKQRLTSELGGNPGFDPDKVLTEPLQRANAAFDQAQTRLYELRIRLEASSQSSLDLASSLEKVGAELEAFAGGQTKLSGVAAIKAEFTRVKDVLDAGLAEGLRLTADQYQRLLAIAEQRRDLSLAAQLRSDAQAAADAAATLQSVIDELLDSQRKDLDFRQRAGAAILSSIDLYNREADATRAGALALAFYRDELERLKVEDDARSKARDAFGDDAIAVENSVARVLKAYDDLKLARREATGKAGADTSDLARAVESLGTAFDQTGKRSARMLADQIVGLNQANFSVGQFIQTLSSGVIEKLIADRITTPLSKIGGGLLDQIAGSFTGGGGSSVANYFGGATPGNAALPFGGPRAEGGDVEPGKVYLVGEKRAELFVPETRGRIIPEVRRTAAPRGGSAGPAQVAFVVQDMRQNPNAPPVEQRRETGPDGRQTLIAIVRDVLPDVLKSGGMDKAFAGNYGLNRQPVRRG